MSSTVELFNKYFFYCEYKTIHRAIENYSKDHYELYRTSTQEKIDPKFIAVLEEDEFQVETVYIEERKNDSFRFRVIVKNFLIAPSVYKLDTEGNRDSEVYSADFELIFKERISEKGLSINFQDISPYTEKMFGDDLKKQHYKPLFIPKESLDKEAEMFLRQYYPEALGIPVAIQDDILLQRMGLTRYYAPLDENTRGRIYLQDSWKETKHRVFANQDIYSENFDENDYEYVRLSENTILVDPRGKLRKNPGALLFTTVHECIHWEKHRKYFQLMHKMEKATEIFINEVKYSPEILKQKGYTQEEIDKLREMLSQEDNYEYYGEYHKEKYCQKNGLDYDSVAGFFEDISLMQWQADALTAHILMPDATVKTEFQELISELSQENEDERQAIILQKAVITLAEIYNVSKQAAKNRVVELGFKTAIGVLNYIDNEYIKPFSFAPEALGKNQTYCLSKASLNEELQRNPKLRKLFDENKVVYVNKMCVVNSPLYIFDDNGTLEMTEYALNRVDQCCLLFDVKKKKSNIDIYGGDSGSYSFINQDWEVNRYLETKVDFNNAHNVEMIKNAEEVGKIKDLINGYLEVLDGLPGSLGGEIETHIKRKAMEMGMDDISDLKLANLSYLSKDTIRKIRSGENRQPELISLLALCKGLNLHPFFIIHILNTAGYNIFTATRENLFYIYLIFYHHGESVDEWAEKMRAAGIRGYFPPGEKKYIEEAKKEGKK